MVEIEMNCTRIMLWSFFDHQMIIKKQINDNGQNIKRWNPVWSTGWWRGPPQDFRSALQPFHFPCPLSPFFRVERDLFHILVAWGSHYPPWSRTVKLNKLCKNKSQQNLFFSSKRKFFYEKQILECDQKTITFNSINKNIYFYLSINWLHFPQIILSRPLDGVTRTVFERLSRLFNGKLVGKGDHFLPQEHKGATGAQQTTMILFWGPDILRQKDEQLNSGHIVRAETLVNLNSSLRASWKSSPESKGKKPARDNFYVFCWIKILKNYQK